MFDFTDPSQIPVGRNFVLRNIDKDVELRVELVNPCGAKVLANLLADENRKHGPLKIVALS